MRLGLCEILRNVWQLFGPAQLVFLDLIKHILALMVVSFPIYDVCVLFQFNFQW